MVFGFTLAVIVGFLFTAGRNWTNQPTPAGWALAALVGLWLAARVLVLTPFAMAAALANVAFPLVAAVGLARLLLRAKNRCNYFFVVLFIVAVMAGRVIPMFTNNGVPGAPADRHHVIEKVSLGAVLPSASLWSAGFGLYAVRYWPVLSRPRVDGRPG